MNCVLRCWTPKLREILEIPIEVNRMLSWANSMIECYKYHTNGLWWVVFCLVCYCEIFATWVMCHVFVIIIHYSWSKHFIRYTWMTSIIDEHSFFTNGFWVEIGKTSFSLVNSFSRSAMVHSTNLDFFINIRLWDLSSNNK